MKTCLLFPVFFSLCFIAHAQNADSLSVVKQVDSLIQVSRTLTDKQDFDKALEANAAAENLALEKLVRESAAYGSCAHNHGRVFSYKGDYLEAEKWYLEAKSIREKVLGKEHPDYAASLSNLASIYALMGNNEKALPLQIEAKAIREKVLGKEHPNYISSLNGLAVNYMAMSNYEKAEPIYIEAKAIHEKVLGKQHFDYVLILTNFAVLYLNMGNYEKAEPLLLEAKAIQEKVLGKEHPFHAQILNSLSYLYMVMGNYEKAELLQLDARAIQEKVLGKEHPDYAQILNFLACLYAEMGNYEKAEPLHLEAKAIREKVLGKEHPAYAESLSNLATLYRAMGNYEKAEPLQLEAKAIREKVLGKEHPDYAESMNNLAVLYMAMGNFEKAEPPFLEARAILEKVIGKERPNYAKSLKNLANLYSAMGNYGKAEPLYKELTQVDQSLLEKAVRHLSDRELDSYLKKFSESQNQALSFVQLSASKKVVPACYDNSLFYKGFLLQAAGQIKRLALSDTAAAEKFNLMKSYERRLGIQYTRPIVERDSADVAELEAKADALAKELARTVTGFGEALRQVNWQEVQATLKPGEAAIEFVNFRFSEKKQPVEEMYAALVLLPGNSQPTFVSLFEEKQLDSLLGAAGERKSDYVKQLYSIADRGIVIGGKPHKTLYEVIWQQLEKELVGTKTIYFSPSGLLHRLNLAAIPIGIDSVLGDRYQLVELGSTRQSVVPNQVKSTANDAILFGGIQYDADSTSIAKAIALIDSVSIASRGELSFFYTDSTLRVGTWGSLPFTDREVGNLERILKTAGIQTQTRRAYTATEESFKTIGAGGKPSPRILHIATHGFFYPDPKTEGTQQSALGGEPIFKISDHPMIRSGLILAGANHAWKTGKPFKPGMEDGILTAYEISQMNLSNTELVVLSACETGLGDIQGNEGVYGLQRAFKIAGAKYLIMSLWQVPDKQTSLLMTAFYKKWLEEKMEIPEAFRAAQKELRDAGLDPYQWAGFVLVE